MRLPRYPHYQDSGVSWIGQVPAHWHVDRFKASVADVRNGIWGDEPAGDETDIACVRVADFDRARLKVKPVIPTIRSVSEKERQGRVLKTGDLLLEKSGGGDSQPVGQVVLFIGDEPAVCSNFVARVELKAGMVPRYWNYAHSAAYAVGVNVGAINQTSGIQNLDQQRYFNERAPFPPEDEQMAIAAFLDHETAKIDGLIAEQEKLIALLAEKRQATISHAVTRGLNPQASMKDSGVPWLGEVPAHWLPRKLIDLADGHQHAFVNGPFGSDLLTSELVQEGVPVIYIRDLRPHGYARVSEWCVTPEKATQLAFCNVLPGDILIAKVGDPPGLAAIYPASEPDGIVTQDVIRLRVNRDLCDAAFLRLLLNSDHGRAAIDQISVESTRTRVGLTDYKQLRFFLPPLEEQREIADVAERQAEKLEAAAAEARIGTALLKERRSALIAAAVTGQIDVRGFTAA